VKKVGLHYTHFRNHLPLFMRLPRVASPEKLPKIALSSESWANTARRRLCGGLSGRSTRRWIDATRWVGLVMLLSCCRGCSFAFAMERTLEWTNISQFHLGGIRVSVSASPPIVVSLFEVLLKSPAIPGLTESLTDLSPTEWHTILAKLRRARLLSGIDPHNPGHLDTHPLVREYFCEQLRRVASISFRMVGV
jgi:hypothetical protein